MIFKRENRKTRHQVQQHAWMTLDGGFAKRNCTVVDVSTTGARLRLHETGAIAGKITIAFTGDVRKSTPCRLVWREGQMIGVEFLSAA